MRILIRSLKSNLIEWLIYFAGVVVLGSTIGYTSLIFPGSWVEKSTIGLGIIALILEIDLILVGFLLPLRKISLIGKQTENSIKNVRKMKAVMHIFSSVRFWLYVISIPVLHFGFALYGGNINNPHELLIIGMGAIAFPLLGLGLTINGKLNEIVESKTKGISSTIS